MTPLFRSLTERLDHDTRQILESAVARLLEDVQQRIDHYPDQPAAWREAISNADFNDAAVVSLRMHQCLTLAETFADELGLVIGEVSWYSLRLRIEHLAALTVHELSMQIVAETLDQVTMLLADRGLEPETVLTADPYGRFPHTAERREGAWQVYEYRNLEGALDVDLYTLEVAGVRMWVREEVEG